MKLKSFLAFSILSAGALVVRVTCHAHSQVYSQGIFSGGTTYYDISSTVLSPFFPYEYRMTEICWLEDTNGLTIIDVQRKPEPGDISRRWLEVNIGSPWPQAPKFGGRDAFDDTFSKDFFMPLDSGPPRFKGDHDPQPVKDSGNFTLVLMHCLTDRGGRALTNALPALQASWTRGTLTNEDIFVLPVDDFVPIQDLLVRAYGKPDGAIHSTAGAGGNCQSVDYSPTQIGVFLNLTRALDDNTIVSIIDPRRPQQSSNGALRANQ